MISAACAWTVPLMGCPSTTQNANGTEESSGGISLSGGTSSAGESTTITTASSSSDGSTEISSAPASSEGESSTGGGCIDDRGCDNGVFCDGIETCSEGECVPGDAIDCADTIDCTIDECDAALDACVRDPSNELCGCGETCDPDLGCGDYCVVATCQGQVYECGNCIDDDGDCAIDSADLDCWGPCHNNESGFDGDVPGQQNQSACVAMDCYFDPDSGSGNDACYWSHTCDPLEPSGCAHDPEYVVPGSGGSCAELDAMQDPDCEAYCGPLTPNGCDCFGCCDVTLDDDTVVTVYLGTLNADGEGTCDLEVINDPLLCHPCTQVASCLNTCGDCEICLGQDELPPECGEQDCPGDLQECGQPGQDPCPENQSCITGCCVPKPG